MALLSYDQQLAGSKLKLINNKDKQLILSIFQTINKKTYSSFDTYCKAVIDNNANQVERILSNNQMLSKNFINQLLEVYGDDNGMLDIFSNPETLFGKIIKSAYPSHQVYQRSDLAFFGATETRFEASNPLLEKILAKKLENIQQEKNKNLGTVMLFTDQLIKWSKLTSTTSTPKIDNSSTLRSLIEQHQPVIVDKLDKNLTLPELKACQNHLRNLKETYQLTNPDNLITEIQKKYDERADHYGNATEPTKPTIDRLISYFTNVKLNSTTTAIPYKKFILSKTNFKEFTNALQDNSLFWHDLSLLQKCTPATLDNAICFVDPEIRGDLIKMIAKRFNSLNDSSPKCYKIDPPPSFTIIYGSLP